MALSPVARRRLERQGFVDIDERDLARAEPWLRLAPGLCALIAAAGTAFASPAVLLALAPFAALGAVLPMHPFDAIYNFGLRRLYGAPPLPPNGPPRRFACAVGAVWLVATAAAFMTGAPVVGYVLGGLLVATAATVSTTHFCVPSLVYGAVCSRLAPAVTQDA